MRTLIVKMAMKIMMIGKMIMTVTTKKMKQKVIKRRVRAGPKTDRRRRRRMWCVFVILMAGED